LFQKSNDKTHDHKCSQTILEYTQLAIIEIEEFKGDMACGPQMKELRIGNANQIFFNML